VPSGFKKIHKEQNMIPLPQDATPVTDNTTSSQFVLIFFPCFFRTQSELMFR